MRVAILNYFNQTNRGDAAILSETLNLFHNINSSVCVDFITLHKCKISTPELENTELLSQSFLVSSPNSSILLKSLEFLYVLIATLAFGFLYNTINIKPAFLLTANLKNVFRVYQESQIVFSMGGGYLTSGRGLSDNLFFLTRLFPIWLSIILGKRTVLLWQSIGPFAYKYQELLVSTTLSKVDKIFVRESISLNLVNRFNLRNVKIVDSCDIAFKFSPGTKEKIQNELVGLGRSERPIVGITARDWFLGNADKRQIYIDSLKKTIQFLLDTGYQVILIPQVTSEFSLLSDNIFLRSLKDHFSENSQVLLLRKLYDHHDVKGLYENLDFLIGMRMHSNIFALTGGTPCIAIAYEHKTRGVMRDLGLENWVIDVESLQPETLVSKIKDLRVNRKMYIEKLQKHLPIHLNKLHNTLAELRNEFQESYE